MLNSLAHFAFGLVLVFSGAVQIYVAVVRWPRSPQAVDDLQSVTDAMIRQSESDAEGIFMIHTSDGKCPDGWQRVPEMFTEKDGSKEDGCLLRKGVSAEVHGDYLKAGESVRASIPILIRKEHE